MTVGGETDLTCKISHGKAPLLAKFFSFFLCFLFAMQNGPFAMLNGPFGILDSPFTMLNSPLTLPNGPCAMLNGLRAIYEWSICHVTGPSARLKESTFHAVHLPIVHFPS